MDIQPSSDPNEAPIASYVQARAFSYISSFTSMFLTILGATQTQPISSLDFHSSGQWLVTASHNTITLYDMINAEQDKKIYNKKTGVDIVKFGHHPSTVIYTGANSNDFSFRYLSTYDNKHLRYFKGHTDRISSMDLSPSDDQIITGSCDGTVLLWDLSTVSAVSMLKLDKPTMHTCVAFDPSGVVFGVGTSPWVRLYDLAKLSQGPFGEFYLHDDLEKLASYKRDPKSPTYFSSITFQPSGEHLLVNTTQGFGLLLNAFNGKVVSSITNPISIQLGLTDMCFSADSNYIMAGSPDGSIFTWKTRHNLVHVWNTATAGTITCIKWNPIHACFATSSSVLSLWSPGQYKTQ